MLKKINRDILTDEQLKSTLKEAIMFTRIKNEDLLHNYLRYFIEDKQLFMVMNCIQVNEIYCVKRRKIGQNSFSTQAISQLMNTFLGSLSS